MTTINSYKSVMSDLDAAMVIASHDKQCYEHSKQELYQENVLLF